MTKLNFGLSAALFLILTSVVVCAQQPPQTRNAALRYWQAFGELQDPPGDKATGDMLEKVSAGDARWNDSLSPIIEKNAFAIEIMQRATLLPECDWGVEYDQGPRASIAYVPRARVLARLNTLYGIRADAEGHTQKAVGAWLAGFRFSQHLAHGGSLLSSLVAARTLISNFHALSKATEQGPIALSAGQRKQVLTVVKQLPETGLDWSQALAYEESPLDITVRLMREANNPAQYFQELMGRPAPANFSVPNSDDMAAFHKLMKAAEEALRESPDVAQPRLQSLERDVQGLHPFYREVTPSFTRINDSRKQVLEARQRLLSALNSR
jgi:hypothetical protein